MDSAIGLSTMIAIGPDRVPQLLAGFHAMDEHFRRRRSTRTFPLLMGLLGVWYTDFFDAQTSPSFRTTSTWSAFPLTYSS